MLIYLKIITINGPTQSSLKILSPHNKCVHSTVQAGRFQNGLPHPISSLSDVQPSVRMYGESNILRGEGGAVHNSVDFVCGCHKLDMS